MPDAIQLLRHADLEQDYASAWNEWESSGDQALWEATADRLRRGIVTRSTRDQQRRPRLPNSGPLRGLERIKPGQWGAVRVVENTTTKQVEREAVTVAVEAT